MRRKNIRKIISVYMICPKCGRCALVPSDKIGSAFCRICDVFMNVKDG